MPLITIKSLPPESPKKIPQMLTEVRDLGAHAFDTTPSNIWVLFRAIEPGHYLQSTGEPASTPQPNSHPPIVIVRAQKGRTAEQKSSLARTVAECVGRGLSIPSANVWIYFQELEVGGVFFGG